jgi:hypothetical protein
MHGCIVVESSHIWVRFESDSRVPKSEQKYHCRCVSSNETYTVFGRDILTPIMEHTELVSEEYKEIPEGWTIEQIFQYLGVPITVT